ncbi:hypothetical protein H3Z83_12260 [Tenacibaculum sp. S7007]|uniref:Uncharacterized protein n=1 Tax=Tenacibaculum pelagium TaxID=2759527 RepID=A0A839ARK2_9FLAO|nr:hypothetical protein [Tenacibaculum pelagium]MBA6157287.1 hypothetical protein [Tenacibaculum pelagium]
MKKTNLLQLLIIVFAMSFITSCEKHKCDDKQEIDPEDIDGYFCYPAVDSRPDVSLNYPEIVTMLRAYDTTRIEPLEKALGYPDSRINTYNFDSFIQYLNYVKKLSKKAGITISGISFISAAKLDYNGTGKSYQDLIYIPTTTINGEQVQFDAVQSVEQNRLVTFKEALAENGYNWIYKSKEEFEAGKRADNNYSIKIVKQNKAGFISLPPPPVDSGAGNFGTLTPPF